MKTIDELRWADDRTLRFTPLGLSLGTQMDPDDAAEYLQQVVAQVELDPVVAEGTRKSFENLCKVFPHGLFCYEIFTLVEERGLLILEQALRDRFIEHYRGTVVFVDPQDSSEHAEAVANRQQLHDAVRASRRLRLKLDDGQTMAFNGMLHDLLKWARVLGLLRGQRNRTIEQAMARLRNLVAHPEHNLATPVDAARTLSDLAEVINHLWGVPTPGGRLYPAPIRREVVVLAWDVAGTELQIALADELPNAVDIADRMWQCAVVRAVFRPEQRIADPGLRTFDSRYEVTHYPAELLWGTGSIPEAAAWYAGNKPEPDECDYLDRTFVVRHDGTNLYVPMRVPVAAALSDADRSGRWYAVKADHPNDAYRHVRTLLMGTGCARRGPCPQCHAETLRKGSHQEVVMAMLDPESPVPVLPSDVATPWALSRFQAIT